MENSEKKEIPLWTTQPFGPGWEEVGEHVDTIVDIWASPVWVAGSAVSANTPAQLATLAETVNRAESAMRQSWLPKDWAEYQQIIETRSLPDKASLADQIAHFEYRLVQAWQAQQVHAYWAQLPADERERQQAAIRDEVNDLPSPLTP
jgi:hypothetical protein